MSKFNELNTAFNTDDDLIQPEVVEKKIEKVKEGVDDIKKDYEYTRGNLYSCLLYTSPSPRDLSTSRMPSSA